MLQFSLLKLNLILILLFAAGNLFAQKHRWDLSIEGGIGVRNLRIDPDYPSLTPTTGISFLGGVAGQYNFSEVWSVKLAAAYETKGTDFDRTDLQTTGSVNLDYVTIPLLIKASTGRRNKFFVNAGPFAGILLSNKTIINEYAGNPAVEMDNTDSTNSTDFGISLRAGVEVYVGRNNSLSLELRENFGFTNISKSKEPGAPEIKTNTFNFVIAYAFKFK